VEVDRRTVFRYILGCCKKDEYSMSRMRRKRTELHHIIFTLDR